MKNKDILNMPLEKMNAITESFSKVSEGKVLSRHEEVELQSQVLSFGRTLSKCSNGHIIPPEFKSIVAEFEKVDYDFTKLPLNLKISIDKTYEDLKTVCEKHSGEFKNTHAKLYCNIYEFFNNATNLKFINRIRKDPIAKEIDKSKESLDFRSLELWLSDKREESNEGIGTFGAIKGAFLGLSTEVSSTLITVQGLMSIIAFLLVVLALLLTTLIIINIQYKIELSEILKHLSDVNENPNSEDTQYVAAKNMISHTNPLTKNIFYKPVAGALNTYNKIASGGYEWFNKMLIAAKNNKLRKNSKEDFSKSNEAAVAGAAAVAGLSAPFWIIFSIIALMIFIKPAVYFVYRLKLKIYEFFNNEAEMLMVNIEDLKAQINNTTSKSEKARLQKIIDKQLKIYNNMSAIANAFYKAEQTASMDARDDTREDDNVNYEEVVNNTQDESVQEISDTTYSTDTDPITATDTTSTTPKPTVIF
jgi:hypothetical protein